MVVVGGLLFDLLQADHPILFGDILFSVNDTYVDSLNLEGLQNSESV